ncbi:hypothetical protein D7Y21_09040 [Corallococcus sp. AB045]|uniref:kelch repeat-containing protein n=1 Tax=Corallococcus sp. AB045 TaxID=2316719 RepID=UPI000ED541A9|nr:kelch repeat-containing protein [Corallococcus sp. AB045]RKH89847.1 hypothetical protein D7Y21_09040 [Corallococcus sp. AB045]
MLKLFGRFTTVALAVLLATACSPADAPLETDYSQESQPLSILTGSLNVGRTSFALTLLQDGKVLVTGGFGFNNSSGTNGSLSSVERYDPATGLFSLVSSMANGRNGHTATLLQDGRVLVVGGYVSSPSSGVTKTVELYNPATGTWSNGAPTLMAHSRHTATLLQDGRVLIAAGTDAITSTTHGTSVCELYNPTTNSWSWCSSLPQVRVEHTATRLLNGKVLLTGGAEYDSNGLSTPMHPVEYDPSTNTWTTRTSPFVSRLRHQAFLLANGSVLLTGGIPIMGGTFNEAELYDPATNTWSATAAPGWRTDAAGAVLADGRVLVVGGYYAGALASSVLYDTQAGTWSAGDSLVTRRHEAKAVRLNDGRVLVVGGYNASSLRTTDAELFTACTPSVTCASEGKNCDAIPDGCGGTLDCGTCGSGQLCEANVCVSCTPTTCAEQGKNCGSIPDGCGGTLACGSCSGTDVCNANVCGSCTPTTCEAQGRSCGTLSDGCGGTLSCGTCAAGNTCGSAGVCIDSTPPTVSLTAPAAGAIVNGMVALTATASDNTGVARVEFYLGGSIIGSVSTAPYTYYWNSNTAANGAATLQARAYDATGNATSSSTVSVTVSNGAANTFAYSAANTNSAQTNTLNQSIPLAAGQTLTLGTCGVIGASFNGDTYLRLYGPTGLQVAFNDDACGGSGSSFTYTVPSGGGGTYQLRAGCYGAASCSGTVAWSLIGGSTPPPSGGNTLPYSTTNTNSAQMNTVNQSIALTAGQTLTLGTCGVTGASFYGDTYLRLFGPTGLQVTYSDDACGGGGSNFTYTVPSGGAGVYQLRAGCYSSNSCSGTVAWTLQ